LRRSSLTPSGSRRLFDGSKFDFVVVVVKANEVQQLRWRLRITENVHARIALLFQLVNRFPFAVLKEIGHVTVHLDLDPLNIRAMDGKLEHAHDVNAHALRGLDLPGAHAMGAILVHAAFQRWTNSL